MNIKLMCLGIDLSIETINAQNIIVKDFKNAFETDAEFENYGSEKSFIRALSQAVKEDDIIVLAAQTDLYLAFKKFVASAFQFKTRPVKTIQKLIKEIYPELDQDMVQAHSLTPTDADAILSGDGLYNGYAINAEDQIMVVVPLDEGRIDYLLEDGVFPFLRDNLEMDQLTSDPLAGIVPDEESDGEASPAENADAESELSAPAEAAVAAAAVVAAAETEEAAEPEETPEASEEESAEEFEPKAEESADDAYPFNAEYIRGVVNDLKEKGLTVAVASTKTVDFIKIVSEVVDMDGCIYISPFTAEKGELGADEFAVKLAKGAFDTSEVSIGAALTKVYAKSEDDGSKSYYMYACVADADSANEAKITAQQGDTPPQLIYKAVEVLFRMLELWAKTGYAEPQYSGEAVVNEDFEPVEENEEAPVKDKKRRRHKFFASGLIIASAIASAVVAILGTNAYNLL